MPTLIPKWESITREERYFTSFLFHELRRDPGPLWDRLKKGLDVDPSATVIDVGYEVCFFRDMAFAGLIERHRDLEKQTFDLVLTLSTGALVIIEAKAQQAFSTRQIKAIRNIRQERLAPSKILHAKHHEVFLVGLCSSAAKCRKGNFDALISWKELADLYPAIQEHLLRANRLYRDRRNSTV